MNPEHIINLQGRDFVKYEGLLDEAHKQGLKSIRTQLVQIPSGANEQTCIVTAEAVFLGANGVERVFTGIGDASPRNVSKGILPHLIRMSETRSKARALRDGTNIGMTAFEELDVAELPAEEGQGAAKATTSKEKPKPASKAQLDTCTRELKRTGTTPEEGRDYLREHFNKISRSELTEAEMERFLAYLKACPSQADV